MRTDGLASLAAAIVVGGGALLAASGAEGGQVPSNGVALNGANASAVASQDFDFNNVAVRTLTWECPMPVDRKAVVFCTIGTSR